MAKTATIARLVAKLELESAEFRANMDRSRKKTSLYERAAKAAGAETKRMGGHVSSLTRDIIGMTGVASTITAVLGGISLTSLVSDTLTASRETHAYANALDISVSSLTAWQYAANEAGIGADQIGDKFKDVSERIAEAYRDKSGEGFEALKSLKMDAADLVALSPDKQLIAIASALDEVQLTGEKVQIMEQLVSDSSLLIPLLADDATRLRELTAEAELLGVAVSDIDAWQMEQANKSWRRAQGLVAGLSNSITAELSPYIAVLSDQFVEAAIEAGGFSNYASKGIAVVVDSVGFLADSWRGIEVIYDALNFSFAAVASGILSGVASLDSGITTFLNKFSSLTGKTFEENRFIQDWADSAVARTELLAGELAATLNKPLPSEGLKAWVAEVEEYAAQVSAKVAAATAGESDDVIELVNTSDKYADEVAAYEASLLTKEQALGLHYATQYGQIIEWGELGVVEDERQKQMLFDLDLRFEQDKTDLYQQEASKRAAIETRVQGQIMSMKYAAANQAIGLAKMLAGENKLAAIAVIAAEKMLGINQVKISTQVAAMRAMAELGPIAGPPTAASIYSWGAISMGLIAATGLVEASSIGGSAPSAGGGYAPPVPPPNSPNPTEFEREDAAEAKTVLVSLAGDDDDLITRGAVRRLIERINDEIGDGAELAVS